MTDASEVVVSDEELYQFINDEDAAQTQADRN
jgi:hypothetical protein